MVAPLALVWRDGGEGSHQAHQAHQRERRYLSHRKRGGRSITLLFPSLLWGASAVRRRVAHGAPRRLGGCWPLPGLRLGPRAAAAVEVGSDGEEDGR